jgi:hypothetical protein
MGNRDSPVSIVSLQIFSFWAIYFYSEPQSHESTYIWIIVGIQTDTDTFMLHLYEAS